jgi:hypothetical protein
MKERKIPDYPAATKTRDSNAALIYGLWSGYTWITRCTFFHLESSIRYKCYVQTCVYPLAFFHKRFCCTLLVALRDLSSLDIPAGSLTHTNTLAHILSRKKLDSGPDQCLIWPDIRLLRIPNGTNTKLKTLSYGKLEKNITIIFVSLCQRVSSVRRKKMFPSFMTWFCGVSSHAMFISGLHFYRPTVFSNTKFNNDICLQITLNCPS